jgi:hypothetical protein
LYVAEGKWFIAPWWVRRGKTGGRKMQDSFAMLLKTNVEKMSAFGLSTMSMKLKGLFCFSRDMHEKKWTWLKPPVENRVMVQFEVEAALHRQLAR